MSAVARKQAPRPARPVARYWRGKAPKGVTELSESEDEDELGEAPEQEEEEDTPLAAVEGDEDAEGEDDGGQPSQIKQKATGKMSIALKDVDIKEGKVIVGGREESGRTAMEEESEEESEDGDEETPAAQAKVESDESSEYDSEEESEEEEEPPKPAFRPVFVPKRGRITIQEREEEEQDTEKALERKRVEEEERRKESHDLVAESIKRELLEKEKEKEVPDVDDTDGLDPDAEFEAWRLRELSRIKRDKEAQAARELEREEIERRRALPEAQRLAEDLEHAKNTRDAKPKGSQKFLQKYWHKGAFHQDLDILKKHDFTKATTSTVDVSILPKVMQVRDFGKRGRTKYTHLMDQDTTVGNGGFGGASLKPGMTGGKSGGFESGCFNCGGPHLKKDCPRLPITGSNNTTQESNKNRTRDADRDKGREKEGDRFRSHADRDRGSNGTDGASYRGRASLDSDLYNTREKDGSLESNTKGRRRPRSRDGRTSSRDRYFDRRQDDDKYSRRRDNRDSYDRKNAPRSRSRSPRRHERNDYRVRESPRWHSTERERSPDESRRGKRQRTD